MTTYTVQVNGCVLNWNEATLMHTLQTVSSANRNCRICRDLSVRHNHLLGRIFWVAIAGHFHGLRHRCYGVDILQTQAILLQLQHKIAPDTLMFLLYMKAIENFNVLYGQYQLIPNAQGIYVCQPYAQAYANPSNSSLAVRHRPMSFITTPWISVRDYFSSFRWATSSQVIPQQLTSSRLTYPSQNQTYRPMPVASNFAPVLNVRQNAVIASNNNNHSTSSSSTSYSQSTSFTQTSSQSVSSTNQTFSSTPVTLLPTKSVVYIPSPSHSHASILTTTSLHHPVGLGATTRTTILSVAPQGNSRRPHIPNPHYRH
jgi:hypothetical protein